MINFKLCYEIPGTTGCYVAPQLLTENQPSYDWDYGNNLVAKYRYEFMPKGIITQFMVAMHRDIESSREVWRSGVILSRRGARAQVIENYGKREIQIRVAGKDKRDLMAVVAYELDRIQIGGAVLFCRGVVQGLRLSRIMGSGRFKFALLVRIRET